MYEQRVVSGMRPTGMLHLGDCPGAIKNWVRLQSEYPCLFFVADWHALTTHYDTPEVIEQHVWDMVIDWLAAGIDPAQAVVFLQTRTPKPAELHTLLSMIRRWDGSSAFRRTRTSRRSCRIETFRPTGFSATRCCRARTCSSTAPSSCRWGRTRCRMSS